MKHRLAINANGKRRIQRLLALGWQPGLRLFGDPKAADWRNPDSRLREPDRAALALRSHQPLDGADIRNSMTWRPAT
ncbi:MAG: hypothetical protein AB9869_02200 [Verrucomicrobiia bacterium]